MEGKFLTSLYQVPSAKQTRDAHNLEKKMFFKTINSKINTLEN